MTSGPATVDVRQEEVVEPRGRAHLEAFGAAMREHHPDAPEHFYLSMIGVDPPL